MPWGLHTEDIIDMQQEGEVLLFMDANEKPGLMGEQVSGQIATSNVGADDITNCQWIRGMQRGHNKTNRMKEGWCGT